MITDPGAAGAAWGKIARAQAEAGREAEAHRGPSRSRILSIARVPSPGCGRGIGGPAATREPAETLTANRKYFPSRDEFPLASFYSL